MKKFEYKKIDIIASVIEPEDLIIRLNAAGLNGWEVMFKDDHWIYLKREISGGKAKQKQLLNELKLMRK